MRNTCQPLGKIVELPRRKGLYQEQTFALGINVGERALIGAFTPRHIHIVRRLADGRSSLCPPAHVLSTRSPLWTAMLDYFLLHELGSYTYVLNESSAQSGRVRGILQMRDHPNGLDSDLLHFQISPEDATLAGERLVRYALAEAHRRGVLRLFGRFRDETPCAAILRRVGFITYTEELYYRLDPPESSSALLGREIASRIPDHRFDSVAQLYHHATPPAVRQIELGGQNAPYILWIDNLQGEAVGWGITSQGQLVGYGRCYSSPNAHWMFFLLHPHAADRAHELIEYGLHLVATTLPLRPVYATARCYDGAIQNALIDHGFTLVDRYRVAVYHIGAKVRATLSLSVALHEPRTEMPPPIMNSESRIMPPSSPKG